MSKYDFVKTKRIKKQGKGTVRLIFIILALIAGFFMVARHFIMQENNSLLTANTPINRTASPAREQVKRWQYVKNLEDSTSPTLQPAQPLPSHLVQSSLEASNAQTRTNTPQESAVQHWQVLCGNFISKDQAEHTKANLAFMGVQSSIKLHLGSYRVWVGEPQSYVQARALQQKINQDKSFSCLVLAMKG